MTTAQSPLSEDPIIKSNVLPASIQEHTGTLSKPARTDVGTSQQPIPNGRKTEPHVSSPKAGVYNGRNYSKEEVIQLIRDYSAQYGISADIPLRVASCESGYNQYSKNKSSSASGAFQYLQSTWRNTVAGKQGISVFDADANVHMAIKSIASGGISNWQSSKSCWNHG